MAETTLNAGTVVGYFETRAKAERAIDALIAEGFTQREIGLATRGGADAAGMTGASGATNATDTTGVAKTTNTTGGMTQTHANRTQELGQEAGAHAESAWSKVKNFFGGDSVEPYADERTEGDFASREVTPDDYQHEDVHGSLEGLTGSGEHAKYFGGRLAQGSEGVVLTVSTPDRAKAEAAERILEENGADLGRSRENFAAATDTSAPAEGAQNIQLFGEVLRVHKDRVSRGEVRLRKEVHTDMQTIQVPVTREELVIERTPVTGDQSATGAAHSFAEKEFRIPLSEERASVEKQSVLREEIRVGKRDVADTTSFNEAVRSEELQVDDQTTGTLDTTGSAKR